MHSSIIFSSLFLKPSPSDNMQIGLLHIDGNHSTRNVSLRLRRCWGSSRLVSSISMWVKTLVIDLDQATYEEFLQDAPSSVRLVCSCQRIASSSASGIDAPQIIKKRMEATKTVATLQDNANYHKQCERKWWVEVLEAHESTTHWEQDGTNLTLGDLRESAISYSSTPRQGHPCDSIRSTRSKHIVRVQA